MFLKLRRHAKCAALLDLCPRPSQKRGLERWTGSGRVDSNIFEQGMRGRTVCLGLDALPDCQLGIDFGEHNSTG